MDTIVGTCSICGGPVKIPALCVDPRPSCSRCGAVPAEAYGPVMKMIPVKTVTTTDFRIRIEGHENEK